METSQPQLKGGHSIANESSPPYRTSGKPAYASLTRLSVVGKVVTICIKAIVGQHCFNTLINQDLLDDSFQLVVGLFHNVGHNVGSLHNSWSTELDFESSGDQSALQLQVPSLFIPVLHSLPSRRKLIFNHPERGCLSFTQHHGIGLLQVEKESRRITRVQWLSSHRVHVREEAGD